MTEQFNDTLIRAAQGLKTAHTPVWFMRQAGRSQPEYRAIKQNYSLFEITHQPELCAQITRLPVEQYQVDAAILYQDIMTPLVAMGLDIQLKSGVGPVIGQPIRESADLAQLRELQPKQDLPYVLDTIKLLTQEQLNVPLIGFSGAPFTLASYLIEGGPSRNYHVMKTLMYAQPKLWFDLLDKLADMIVIYLKAQVAAGAGAIQIFDSWVGALSAADYQTFVKPVMVRIFQALKPLEVPMILFGVGANHLLSEFNDLPVNVIGLDWRLSVAQARNLGLNKALQGNLDPSILLAPWSVIEKRVRMILDEGLQKPGFIFNLGHGVLPETNPAVLKKLAQFVHDYSAEKLGTK